MTFDPLFEKSRGHSSRCCGLSLLTYISTHHGLGGLSRLINGLIAAAISTLRMLMSEPTAEMQCKEYVGDIVPVVVVYLCSLTSALIMGWEGSLGL